MILFDIIIFFVEELFLFFLLIMNILIKNNYFLCFRGDVKIINVCIFFVKKLSF